MDRIIPVIVCGGVGTRLWPVSRQTFPKQFAALDGDKSLLQDTVLRVANRELFDAPIIIGSAEHRFIIERQLGLLGCKATILLEPEPRDSGPAMLAGALWAAHHNPQVPLLFLAADHRITPIEEFEAACRAGLETALDDRIVLFGITPTGPETRYGYIRQGTPINETTHRVRTFVEKPNLETARGYVNSGYLWYSGNFLARARVLIEDYEQRASATVAAVRMAVSTAKQDLAFMRLDADAFAAAKPESIDRAVMEHTSRGAVITAKFGWSDLGTWDACWRIGPQDAEHNVFASPTAAIDAQGCLTRSDEALITLIGVNNLAVIATRDAILVADRSRADEVKQLVAELRRSGRPQAVANHRSYRPWGWYQILDSGARFQVKRIVVYPSGQLSLQQHFHRAEHWIVVRGTARVTNGDSETLLRENESTYIPLGNVHRLENPGKIDLELIEVQSGSYLAEDDIVRLEDHYQRA